MKKKKREKRRRRFTWLDQLVMGFLLISTAIFVAAGAYAYAAIAPYSSTQARAIRIAKAKTDLVTASRFAIVTTDETVYSVTGRDKAGQSVAVLIPKAGHQLTELQLTDGVAASSVAAATDETASPGLYKGRPIWEVNGAKTFKIYDFKTGKAIK